MSAGEDPTVHPNLQDALEADAPDVAALDLVARRLGSGDVGGEAPMLPPDLRARILAAAVDDAPVVPAPVVEISSRRRRVGAVIGAVAAAFALVAVGIAVTRDDGSSNDPVEQEIALGGLPGFESGAGTATLVVDGDDRELGVDVSGVDVPAGSHLELWLLDPAVEEIVSLGVIEGAGPHAVPGDVDLSRTPIVDVSLEPDDGPPTHSGVSVVRGEIEPS